MEMMRSKKNARLYEVHFQYSVKATSSDTEYHVVDQVESIYAIP
jgi:hypothetical protein